MIFIFYACTFLRNSYHRSKFTPPKSFQISMDIVNIEIKAPVKEPRRIAEILCSHKARFVGEDFQTDTYFNADHGRLKLRQGNIENALIRYRREETQNLKRSDVNLQVLSGNNSELRNILADTYGVMVTVQKRRRIYFIDNVKFHIDYVQGLGSFVEIEVADHGGTFTESELKSSCKKYIKMLGLKKSEFIAKSYSDMIRDLK